MERKKNSLFLFLFQLSRMEKHCPRTKEKMLKTKYGSIVASEIFSLEVVSTSFPTPWTVACQAPLFMEFSRQEYWSGLPFPSSWVFPDPGIKPTSSALQGRFLTTEPLGKSLLYYFFNSCRICCDILFYLDNDNF